MAPRPPFPLFSQIAKKVFFNDEGLLKDMLSLTLTLGWKNEKRPSGPIELDLEADNLVTYILQNTCKYIQRIPKSKADITIF